MSDEGESFKLKGIKKMLDSTVVDYAQTYYGLPVWRSGLTVVMQDEPLQVLSSSNSSQMAMKVHKPKLRSPAMALAHTLTCFTERWAYREPGKKTILRSTKTGW